MKPLQVPVPGLLSCLIGVQICLGSTVDGSTFRMAQDQDQSAPKLSGGKLQTSNLRSSKELSWLARPNHVKKSSSNDDTMILNDTCKGTLSAGKGPCSLRNGCRCFRHCAGQRYHLPLIIFSQAHQHP